LKFNKKSALVAGLIANSWRFYFPVSKQRVSDEKARRRNASNKTVILNSFADEALR
jgi:hypothetical protein